MITTVLNGGLGNQLFQIAAAYAVAIDNKDDCAFDMHNTVVNQGNSGVMYKSNFYYYLNELSRKWKPVRVYRQPRFSYDPIPYHNNMRLEGYFQSYKFFGGHDREIRNLFLNDNVEIGIINRLKERYSVELRESIGVHVRRGDYLKFPEHHPAPGLGYYWNAIEYIIARHNISCVLVFSDDIPWCRANLYGNIFRYVEGLPDYEDMCLMSLCNHNIIANSSFSWWASFFNKNNGITCAPKMWFGAKGEDKWDDIYRNDMVVI